MGTGTLSAGTATLSTTFTTTGTHSITANYSGDATYAASTSSAVSINVSATGNSAECGYQDSTNSVYATADKTYTSGATTLTSLSISVSNADQSGSLHCGILREMPGSDGNLDGLGRWFWRIS